MNRSCSSDEAGFAAAFIAVREGACISELPHCFSWEVPEEIVWDLRCGSRYSKFRLDPGCEKTYMPLNLQEDFHLTSTQFPFPGWSKTRQEGE